jgi:post-segregation antitoxin (ccd killing protein)
MNHNLYLPDDLGARAKAAELNLSRLLRDAVTDELERRAAVNETLAKTKEHLLNLTDDEERPYQGRLTGTEIAYDERNDIAVYLTDDERVIVHDGQKEKLHDLSVDPYQVVEETLRNWLDDDAYIAAMHALGMAPVIDV